MFVIAIIIVVVIVVVSIITGLAHVAICSEGGYELGQTSTKVMMRQYG